LLHIETGIKFLLVSDFSRIANLDGLCTEQARYHTELSGTSRVSESCHSQMHVILIVSYCFMGDQPLIKCSDHLCLWDWCWPLTLVLPVQSWISVNAFPPGNSLHAL